MKADRGLEGKTAVVTGGSSGIGFSIAKDLLEEGVNVTITGRSAERGEEALGKLRKVSNKVSFVSGDGLDYNSSVAAFQQASRSNGNVDLLVSSGAEGPFGPKPFAEMTPEEIQSSHAMRFYPRIYPVHAGIPFLQKKGGSVVMITTDAARVPTPGESIIGAVGASAILLTKALAREFSRWNIRVNSVAITLTSDTPSWDRIFSKQDFENKLFSKALARFPSGRAPTSDEVSKAAVFLLSNDASQVNGQTLSVNGGLSFGGW